MFTNNYSDEGNISGEKVITFPWRPKELQITNDSETKPLKFKFNDFEDYRTLMPYETSTVCKVSIRTLYLLGSNVDYRVWGLG
jgi:hypothetical protein